MLELNDNDIVNRIAEVLKRQGNSTIRYDVVDLQSRVPEGSTARFLRVAVEDAGMEVVREGLICARLRVKSFFDQFGL